jgi:glucose/arabinose dehydrogenase
MHHLTDSPSHSPGRSVALATAIALLTMLLALTTATGAAAATNYRPNYGVHFDAGRYTGYRFSSTGTVTASRTATLSSASSAATRLRTAIVNHPGVWLLIVNGIWAGYYVRESSHGYLPYVRARLVRFTAGAHTGYRFDAAGAVVARKTYTLSRASTASAIAQATVGTASYFLIANGVWAGYWVPASDGVALVYPPLGPNRLGLLPLVGGLSAPLFVTNAADKTNRLFVVERAGRVRVVSGGVLRSTPFLDITSRVGCCDGERGLLGLAFHPGFATNRRLFVYYTNLSGNIVVAEYSATAAGGDASASSERVLLTIPHPTYANHDGGWIGFGKDGYLYIATGDGGGGGDPNGNAQNRFSLLGKMVRINVNGAQPYTIPPSNPFAVSGGAKEVWAYGLRNPWRDSFDRLTGDLYIGDVGQSAYEEIDRAANGRGGQNYGWNVMEGFSCYNATSCSTSGKTLPIAVYPHGTSGSIGCSVTGGYLYRGAAQPALQGQYLLGDYCSGRLWTLYQDEDVGDLVQQADLSIHISSFGEGENGEIYVTDLSGGTVSRVVVH